jgi:hypothetical protein
MDQENVDIFTVDYYSAVDENEIMSSAGEWKKLEIIMIKKVSQVQKEKGCMFSLMCGR